MNTIFVVMLIPASSEYAHADYGLCIYAGVSLAEAIEAKTKALTAPSQRPPHFKCNIQVWIDGNIKDILING